MLLSLTGYPSHIKVTVGHVKKGRSTLPTGPYTRYPIYIPFVAFLAAGLG
jgi:hypothetical protein